MLTKSTVVEVRSMTWMYLFDLDQLRRKKDSDHSGCSWAFATLYRQHFLPHHPGRRPQLNQYALGHWNVCRDLR